MLKPKIFFLLFISVLIFSQCLPAKEEILTTVDFDLYQPQFQKFYDLQDRQLTDSLVASFEHRDPSYRYAAALAMASIKDSTEVNSLARLLEDDIEEVRVAAAYAMGQLGTAKGEKWLIKAFQQYDSAGIHHQFNSTILEAVGKCGSKQTLKFLSTTKAYDKADTLLLEGQSRGIYQFALRGITTSESTERMANFLIEKGYPSEVRMMAANYFYRAKRINLDSFINPLIDVFFVEKDPRVRMALAIGLGKTKSPLVLEALTERLGRERDYRVKCNIIRSLGNFEYRKVANLVIPFINDKNIHVATTAADYFINNGTPQMAGTYRQLARKNDSLDWRVQSKLYQAANKNLNIYSQGTRMAIQYELKDQFKNGNDFQKVAALRSLGEFGKNYKDIYEMGFTSNKPIIRSACIEALAMIAKNPDFDRLFSSSRKRVKKEIAAYFQETLEKGDAAMIAIAAGVIREPSLDFKSVYDTLNFLEVAKNRLELPKETETLYEVIKTIDFFNGKKESDLPTPKFNNEINWRIFNTINSDTKAEIKTEKGTFVIQFFPTKAPGSVTNFVALAKSGFYDGKIFHRVVPNFVAQGGCPRGDGYGSLEYTIRSELAPLRYDQEGYIGMASAGNHTEGTQWFVTHSPAPHLDGKYTIFAKVIDGMSVVHQLAATDRIQQVQIVE